MDEATRDREAAAAVMEAKTAAAPRKFLIGETVKIDATLEILDGQDRFDPHGINPSGGKGVYIPPKRKVSVKGVNGVINAEPYYSERHKDLVYPVMENHPSGGLMGVPQKALRRPIGRRVAAGFNRLYARGYELIFGPKPVDQFQNDEDEEQEQ